jgi:hypothetical protein
VVFLARESCLKFCGFRHTVSKRQDRTWLPAVTGDVSPPRMFQEHVESFYRQQPSDHAMPIPPCLMLCRPFDLATAKRATPRRDRWCGGPGQQMRASRARTSPIDRGGGVVPPFPPVRASTAGRAEAAGSRVTHHLSLSFSRKQRSVTIIFFASCRIKGPPPRFTPVKMFHFARSLVITFLFFDAHPPPASAFVRACVWPS